MWPRTFRHRAGDQQLIEDLQSGNHSSYGQRLPLSSIICDMVQRRLAETLFVSALRSSTYSLSLPQ
jgi:hypothetical protein